MTLTYPIDDCNRIVKFTADSILNIDPKSNRIQNEKKLTDIEGLGIFNSNLEIQMQFSNSKQVRALRSGPLERWQRVNAICPSSSYVCVCVFLCE